MPRMNNDHVSHYSEEANVETDAGIVVYLYRIVPHIHSAFFPLFICVKNPQLKYGLESESPVSRMRGKHVPEGVDIFEANL